MAQQQRNRRQFIGGGLAAAGALTSFGTAAAAQELAHLDEKMLYPEAPTNDRPYHYVRFDASTKESHPHIHPVVYQTFHDDKFVLMNFVDASDAGRDRSILQMRLLDKIAKDLTPVIGPKKFLIVDTLVKDHDGTPLYPEDYQVHYERNQLGHDNTLETDQILPYGVAFSQSVRVPELGMQRLMDFSVNRFNVSEAQLRENIIAIGAGMSAHARDQNL